MKRDRYLTARKRAMHTFLRPITRLVGVPLPGPTIDEHPAPSSPSTLTPAPGLLAIPVILAPLQTEQPPSPAPRINRQRLAAALLLSAAVGGLAYRRGSLSASGWLGAVMTGTATLGFGGWSWGMTLISFFVSSSLLSHYKENVKEQRTGGKFAKGARRDLAQALANAGVGSLLALAYALLREPPLLKATFVGVMGTVTADTWATELGVLSSEQPRLITTLQKVERGTSGAITIAGTGASAAGGLLIGLAMLGFSALEQSKQRSSALLWMAPAGLLGGLAGSLSDSLMAATVQVKYRYPDGQETERPRDKDGTPNTYARGWPWLNNDLVNMLSTLTGGAVAVVVYRLLEK